MNTEKLDAALQLCVGDDFLRKWMLTPFYVNGWNVSTNAHVMLGYKGEQRYHDCEASEQAQERITAWISGEAKHVFHGSLLTSKIKEVMDVWPQADVYEQVKCDGCGGHGTDEECDDGLCFSCDGLGTVDGDKVVGTKPDITEKVRVEGLAHFMPGVWSKILAVSETLGIEAWAITHGDDHQFTRLEADGVVMCVMPCMPNMAEGQAAFQTVTP